MSPLDRMGHPQWTVLEPEPLQFSDEGRLPTGSAHLTTGPREVCVEQGRLRDTGGDSTTPHFQQEAEHSGQCPPRPAPGEGRAARETGSNVVPRLESWSTRP